MARHVSILSDFEDNLARTVEGVFAGAFRSPVQPAEVAKALAKTMDSSRLVGVGKVYVPVSYSVAISEEDSEQMGVFTDTLAGELETYLIAHAREREYHLTSRPKVNIITADVLKLGRFEVQADSEAAAPEPPATKAPASAWDSPVVPIEPAEVTESADAPTVGALSTVTIGGIHHDVALKGERMVAGRLAGSDICLDDANASREHVAFVREHDGWWVEDLKSTNGTLVNGSQIDRHHLSNGDVIQIGVTELVYHEPKG